MPNEYSIEFHTFISDKLQTIRSMIEQGQQSGDHLAEAYWRGQELEVEWIRAYLKERIDLQGFSYY